MFAHDTDEPDEIDQPPEFPLLKELRHHDCDHCEATRRSTLAR